MTSTITIKGKGGKVHELSLRTDVLELVDEYRKGERISSPGLITFAEFAERDSQYSDDGKRV